MLGSLTLRANSSDVSTIAQHTGMPEFQIRRVKDHLFINEHQLGCGKYGRFNACPLTAEAWYRLEANTFTKQDLALIRHELFEAKFEGIFDTDYMAAHKAANKVGYLSGIEGLSDELLEELTSGFLHRIRKDQ